MAPWGRLKSINADSFKSIDCDGDEVVCGRHPDCHPHSLYDDPSHSNRHFRVYEWENDVWLDDLSSNGTYVDGGFVGRGESVQLEHGTTITLVVPSVDDEAFTKDTVAYLFEDLRPGKAKAGGAAASAAPTPPAAATEKTVEKSSASSSSSSSSSSAAKVEVERGVTSKAKALTISDDDLEDLIPSSSDDDSSDDDFAILDDEPTKKTPSARERLAAHDSAKKSGGSAASDSARSKSTTTTTTTATASAKTSVGGASLTRSTSNREMIEKLKREQENAAREAEEIKRKLEKAERDRAALLSKAKDWVCGVCDRQIKQEPCEMEGTMYHARCFVCARCDESLAGKKGVKALGLIWHDTPACWQCTKCAAPLRDEYNDAGDGMPYCKRCG